MLPPRPLAAHKGRGAVSNIQGRYEMNGREGFDDGWDAAGEGGDAPAFKTQVTDEVAKSILSRNASPDIPFKVSLNPYRGCEHGCIYCYARPTHSYLNMSPGLDFETKIIAKSNLAQVLRRQLAGRRYEPKMIAIGTATDCYQPVERELRLTRAVIELFNETHHPFGLVTKSSGVERDLDLIA
ncbi:MAG: radical protein, partial [Massilia sp.]|nr:radical protein [Massilia sp.]